MARLFLHSRLLFRPRTRLLLAVGTGLAASPFVVPRIHGDSLNDAPITPAPPISSLLRAYLVYFMCSIPPLVDASPAILDGLTRIPGIKHITEAFVRVTFFDHFVGGDTATDTLPLLHALRAQNKGALFAYSVEVDEKEANAVQDKQDAPPHKRFVDEMIRCIDVAADFEDGLGLGDDVGKRRTWVAIKMTALLPDAHALINLSKHIVASRRTSSDSYAAVPFPGSPAPNDLDVLYPPDDAKGAYKRLDNGGADIISSDGISSTTDAVTPAPNLSSHLSHKDISSLRELYADLERICDRAQDRGVKVIVDAEYSWYQPALDALTLGLMRKYNKLPEHESKLLLTKSNNEPTKTVQPLVYGTFQAYLRRTPLHLALSIHDARTHGYALGVKLVRGAYHPHELAAHDAARAGKASLSISEDGNPPVWDTKEETDECYDGCARVLVRAVVDDVRRARGSFGSTGVGEDVTRENRWSWFRSFWPVNTHLAATTTSAAVPVTRSGFSYPTPSVGVLFGTHNWNSCKLILAELVRGGLAVQEVHKGSAVSNMGEGVVTISDAATERVALGQLYGMSDELTDWLVHRTKSTSPFVIKYVPYGALTEVMPYLGRRAIENKSMLGEGAADRERQRAGRELWRRILGRA